MAIERMTATEARKAAVKVNSAGGESYEPLMDHVMTRIREAVDKGQHEMAHPFHGYDKYPSEVLQKSIRRALEGLGYEWTHHPELPGNTDPREHSYDTVSW